MSASIKSQTTTTSKSAKKVPVAQQTQTKLTGWKLWVGLVLLLIGGLGLFMGQMWTMLVIAGAVALALSLRNYAKRIATRAINSFDNAKAK